MARLSTIALGQEGMVCHISLNSHHFAFYPGNAEGKLDEKRILVGIATTSDADIIRNGCL